MAFNKETGGGDDVVQDQSSDCSILAEAHLMLATLSAILMDLSESYYAIVHSAVGCLDGLFWLGRLGELDLVVQEALAAYARQVLRHVTYEEDEDELGKDGRDVRAWVGLLSTRIEGRVRRRSTFLTDVTAADSSPPPGISLTDTIRTYYSL